MTIKILYKFLKKLHDWIAGLCCCSVIDDLVYGWGMVGGWFGDVQEQDLSPWTWTVMWDWIVAFPWIPALYTGAFSTELCLWVEVLFSLFETSCMIFQQIDDSDEPKLSRYDISGFLVFGLVPYEYQFDSYR